MPVWGRGGDIEVGEHIKTIDRGKARGSDRRRVMTEIVLCVWVRIVCRKRKDRGGNRQVTKGRDHETDKEA